MRPTRQSIAYNLDAAVLLLQNAQALRAEQRRSILITFDREGQLTRRVNQMVRARSQAAIAYTLRAVCMIRAGSRFLA
jgi:hypothetical protein